MRKITKILLISAVSILLLTGCYKQDTKIEISPLDKVYTELSFIGTEDSISMQLGGQSYDEAMEYFVSQVDLQKTDPEKQVIEGYSEDVDGTPMKGFRYSGNFANFDKMLADYAFAGINSQLLSVPVTSGKVEEGQNGIQVRTVQHWYGTEYFFKGNITLTQGDDYYLDMAKDELTNASVNMAFKFPFTSFTKENGRLKPFKNSYSYTVNQETPNLPVDLYAFNISFPMLVTAFIILALLVALIVLSKKLKKLTGADNESGSDDLSDTTVILENTGEFIEESAEGVAENAEDALENAEEAAENFAEPENTADEETDSADSGDNE